MPQYKQPQPEPAEQAPEIPTEPTEPTEPRSEHVAEREVAAEQAYVDRVYARLDELVDRARAFRREGAERGKLDYTGEIKEEDYRGLFERDVMVDNAVRRLALLDAQRDGLVFGRLDLTSGVARYVGRIGVRDEDQEPLVVDWRAPAAADFYQATPVEPRGVVRRRVLRTLGQRVVGVEDDLLDPDAAPDDLVVVGDGALMAALTAARGPRMRDIVATIQREQDEIVRAPSAGATLITGGPGTGKTVVALHRAAYLLYTERQRMARGGVLVVGPSPVFMAYIERVLPSLGERDATLRSLGEVYDGVVATRRDPYDVAAVKGSTRMRAVLNRAVREAPPGVPDRLRLHIGGRTLRLEPGELRTLRRDAFGRTTTYHRARHDARTALLNALWRQASADRAASEWRGGRGEFVEAVGEADEFVDFLDAWWPDQTAAEVLARVSEPERFERYARGILGRAEIAVLAQAYGERRAELGGASPVEKAELSVEDVPLLDELHALLGPIPPRRVETDDVEGVFDEFLGSTQSVADQVGGLGSGGGSGPGGGSGRGSGGVVAGIDEQYDNYAHVLVDEAQDLTPMQWRMLGRRGVRASWTIVGDAAQSSWFDTAEAERAREQALGRRPRRAYRLSTNYRNSAEIFEFAAALVGRLGLEVDPPEAVRRTGVRPARVRSTPDGLRSAVGSAAREALGEVEGTVAVVVPQARRDEVARWLGELPLGEPGRLSVLDPVSTKGLEYDAVVVVTPEEIAAESPVGVRTLYVALTRATQRLTTIELA